MATSLLIEPANWTGMTYPEILRMLWQATGERLQTCAPDRFNNFRNQTQKLDYMTMLRNITSALKNMLNEEFSGFWNPAFDPFAQAFPPTFVTQDLTWNMTDMLADIGDAFFYDFSTAYNAPPTPFFNYTVGYRQGVDTGMPAYLVQYYNMITRLKKPVMDWQLVKNQFEYGLWDEGVETSSVANGERTPGSNSGLRSRRLTLFMEGQSVGYGSPFNDPYEPWPAVQPDHDADYGLIYQFPPNTGSSRPGAPGTVLELEPRDFLITTTFARFQAAAVDTLGVKDGQDAAYTRVRTNLNYQNFSSGALNGITGRPRDVQWLAYTLDEPDGDLGNPFLKNQLFWVDQTFTGDNADDLFLGDFPGRGAAPDIPVGESQGFQYHLWQLTLFEDWDYEGGYDYYTP